jgi:hypothetical protein
MRKLSREYGYSALGVYLLLSALDFPLCFVTVRTLGTDTIGRWEHAALEWLWSVVPRRLFPFSSSSSSSSSDSAAAAHEAATSGAAAAEDGGAGALAVARAEQQQQQEAAVTDIEAAERRNAGSDASTFFDSFFSFKKKNL